MGAVGCVEPGAHVETDLYSEILRAPELRAHEFRAHEFRAHVWRQPGLGGPLSLTDLHMRGKEKHNLFSVSTGC